jgi:hypothetical protein
MQKTETPETLMADYLTLVNRREMLNQQIDEIKAELARLNPAGGEILGKKIILSWPRRTNWRKLEADFPQDHYPQLYKTSLDQTAAKKNFSEVQLAAYQEIPDHPTVTIR